MGSITADQRFTLLLFILGTLAAMVGWFVRRLVKKSDDARTANTKAIEDLTDAVNQLRLDYARLEARIKRRRWF